MGTGWRRAFCTTIPRNSSDSPVLGDVPAPSPRTSGKVGFFKSSGSNPYTPRLQSNWSLRSRSSNTNNGGGGGDENSTNSNTSTPRLRLRPHPKTNNNDESGDDDGKFQSSVIDNLNITPRLRCKTSNKNNKSSLLGSGSNHSSPRSPFSIFKNSLGFSRSNCGLCLQSVKTGNRTAIFTAECSHTFHFPCISKHVKNKNVLACPVCKSEWRDGSFLAVHKLQTSEIEKENDEKKEITVTTLKSKHEFTRSQENLVKPKAYDDDEPLRTPRTAGAGGGIIPIPEAEEENEESDEEFKGFFVNQVTSTADEFRRDFKNVEVMLMSEVAVISSNQTYETYAVVLKVKAPPPLRPLGAAHMVNQSRRAPIDLVAVLDVSASMGGAKLQMLKRAMLLVISSLSSADRLSIVAFSASPKRLLPLRRMSPKGQRSARRIIDQLTCSRGNSAGEALRKATKVLEDRRERNPVASIILLSDGHEEHAGDNNDNSSNQRQPTNHVSSTRFAHVEIPVHTLDKTGEKGFSRQTLDLTENAFTKCVGGLLSVVAQNLRIQLGVVPGSDPAEITAVYSCNGKPTVLNSGSVRFGDLYAEEEREVLVEMQVPRSNTGSHHVLSAHCYYNDPATQEVINAGEKTLLVPRAQTVRSSCSTKIEWLRNLFIATRAVAEARLLVEHNKLMTAHHLLSSARALLRQSMSAEEFLRGLELELVDVQWRVQYQQQMLQQQHQQQQQQQQQAMMMDENGEPLTPTSTWRTVEKLAKVAVIKKPLNRDSDLLGFENARF